MQPEASPQARGKMPLEVANTKICEILQAHIPPEDAARAQASENSGFSVSQVDELRHFGANIGCLFLVREFRVLRCDKDLEDAVSGLCICLAVVNTGGIEGVH